MAHGADNFVGGIELVDQLMGSGEAARPNMAMSYIIFIWIPEENSLGIGVDPRPHPPTSNTAANSSARPRKFSSFSVALQVDSSRLRRSCVTRSSLDTLLDMGSSGAHPPLGLAQVMST